MTYCGTEKSWLTKKKGKVRKKWDLLHSILRRLIFRNIFFKKVLLDVPKKGSQSRHEFLSLSLSLSLFFFFDALGNVLFFIQSVLALSPAIGFPKIEIKWETHRERWSILVFTFDCAGSLPKLFVGVDKKQTKQMKSKVSSKSQIFWCPDFAHFVFSLIFWDRFFFSSYSLFWFYWVIELLSPRPIFAVPFNTEQKKEINEVFLMRRGFDLGVSAAISFLNFFLTE